MEGASSSKSYRRRRKGRQKKPRMPVATLGSGSAPKKCFSWKIRIKKKLRFIKSFSKVNKFLTYLKKGYIKLMLSFSDLSVYGNGFVGGEGHIWHGVPQEPIIKEHDERLIMEIYKRAEIYQSMIAKGQLVPLPEEAMVCGA